jgi:hypothetical protein
VALFKLGGKIFSIGDDIHLLAELDHKREDGAEVVRFQSRNRRDEVTVVAGRAVHIKHGVYELDPELSKKFTWFMEVFGQSIGLLDVDARYDQREEIEKAIAEIKARGPQSPQAPVANTEGVLNIEDFTKNPKRP